MMNSQRFAIQKEEKITRIFDFCGIRFADNKN